MVDTIVILFVEDEVLGEKITEGIWAALPPLFPLERFRSRNHSPHMHRKGRRRQQLLEVMREQLLRKHGSDFSPSPSPCLPPVPLI